MFRRSTSVAGVRFLAAIKEGRGLKRSARVAGIDKEVGDRWLRERYLRHRRGGLTPAEAQAQIGFESVRIAVGVQARRQRTAPSLRRGECRGGVLGGLRLRG